MHGAVKCMLRIMCLLRSPKATILGTMCPRVSAHILRSQADGLSRERCIGPGVYTSITRHGRGAKPEKGGGRPEAFEK